jgi:hypothetical protein
VPAPSDLRHTAREFVVAAFDVLRRDHVIPTPVFNPYVRVGRDYYGPQIMGLEQYKMLELKLNDLYPNRFPESLTRDREFASTYMFSLLEASVARCGRMRDFAPGSPMISKSIDEMLVVLDAEQYEVVCCRMVSHLTTEDGQPVQIGPITVIPAEDGSRSLDRVIAEEIPAAAAALNREQPFAYDPPHSLLIAKDLTDEGDSYAVADRLSQSLERFLLHMRLLTSGTVQSYYEMRGTTTLVTRMEPSLTTFFRRTSHSPVRRTVRVRGDQAEAVAAIKKLLDTAEVKRQGMVLTSLDVATSKFHESYWADSPFEQLVALATALEATLASGETDNEGLTLRLRNRASALLATKDDSAQSIFTDVNQLYGLRSKLVHGGQIKERELSKTIERISTVPGERPTMMFQVALGHAIDRMRDLVRRAILARLCLAAEPDPAWPFAGSRSVDALLADDSTRREWRNRWHAHLGELGVAAAGRPPQAAADFLTQEDR